MPVRIKTVDISLAEVTAATAGDSGALEQVVKAVMHDAYGLALRFLWHPDDAEDATQEIAIRVVTGLASFDGRSSFRTWVYRIACNTLSNLARRQLESVGLSFESMSDELLDNDGSASLVEQRTPFDAALVEEVKIGCTHAMLLCLDRDHRLAYILGTILDLDHREAASALSINPAAFRKRLSRANARISEFLGAVCGITNPNNSCRCEARVPKAINCGRLDVHSLKFVKQAATHIELQRVVDTVRHLEAARRAAELYRSHPDFDSSSADATWVSGLLGPFQEEAPVRLPALN
jgi:RNA polymerase sigma factor (sigma-70 family)